MDNTYNNVTPITYSTQPLTDVSAMTRCYIVQEDDTVAMSYCCNMKKVYSVYGDNSEGKVIHLFKVKDNTNKCLKWCVGADRLPVNIDINTVIVVNGCEERKTFINMGRLCKNCHHTYVNVDYVENGRSFGTVDQQPCTCASHTFEVKDELDMVRYHVVVRCEQQGFFWRRWCCCAGKPVEFDIYGEEGMGEVVGKIYRKERKGCCYSKVECCYIDFPKEANAEDKVRLICAGMLLEHLFFEEDTHTS